MKLMLNVIFSGEEIASILKLVDEFKSYEKQITPDIAVNIFKQLRPYTAKAVANSIGLNELEFYKYIGLCK